VEIVLVKEVSNIAVNLVEGEARKVGKVAEDSGIVHSLRHSDFELFWERRLRGALQDLAGKFDERASMAGLARATRAADEVIPPAMAVAGKEGLERSMHSITR
jgi:hypothetical protein